MNTGVFTTAKPSKWIVSHQAYVQFDISHQTEYNLYCNHVKNFVGQDIIFWWPTVIPETALFPRHLLLRCLRDSPTGIFGIHCIMALFMFHPNKKQRGSSFRDWHTELQAKYNCHSVKFARRGCVTLSWNEKKPTAQHRLCLARQICQLGHIFS